MDRKDYIEKYGIDGDQLHDLDSMVRSEKVKASQSFAKLVGSMRRCQLNYFRASEGSVSRRDLLSESKKLEKRVDRAVDAIKKWK